MSYRNRQEAGEALVQRLSEFKGTDAVVVGIARGGIVAGGVVAERLGLPLVPLVVKRVRSSADPDFAIGACAEDRTEFVRPEAAANEPEGWISKELDRVKREAADLRAAYGGSWPGQSLEGRTVLLVDDAATTGYTLEVAVQAVRKLNPQRVVGAVPIMAERTALRLAPLFNKLVGVMTPMSVLHARHYYQDFPEVHPEEVRAIIARTAQDGWGVQLQPRQGGGEAAQPERRRKPLTWLAISWALFFMGMVALIFTLLTASAFALLILPLMVLLVSGAMLVSYYYSFQAPRARKL